LKIILEVYNVKNIGIANHSMRFKSTAKILALQAGKHIIRINNEWIASPLVLV